MQLSTTPTATPPSRSDLGIDVIAARLESQVAKLAALDQERTHREREANEERLRLRQEGEKAISTLREEYDLPVAEIDPKTAFARLQASRERYLTRLAQAGTRMRRAVRSDLEASIEQLSRIEPMEHARVPLGEERKADITRQRKQFQLEVGALRKELREAVENLERCALRAGVFYHSQSPAPLPLPAWDLPRLTELVEQEIASAQGALDTILSGSGYSTCRPAGLFLHYGVVMLPLALLAVAAWLLPIPSVWPWAAAGGGIATALVALFIMLKRQMLKRQLVNVDSLFSRTDSRLAQLEASGLTELDPQMTLKERLDKLQIDDRPAKAKKLQDEAEQEISRLRQREKLLTERVRSRYTQTLGSLQASFDERSQKRQGRFETVIAREEAQMQSRISACDQRWDAVQSELLGRWKMAVMALQSFTSDAMARCAKAHPAWADPQWSTWSPPSTYATEVPVGSLRMPISTLINGIATREGHALPSPPDAVLEIPVALAFPIPSSLLIRASPNCREAALSLANQLVLRSLTAFPAGRLKLTLIDPVGLGDSFKGLLEMADHDEALLGGGILNDGSRIERGLDDLIAHLEMVIQKHLRGRYATIDDYNREAGEMQEALRLVVVADFPSSFSERALEQLSVLARSGARCGVHLVVLHDDRKPIPSVLDLAWFRRSGLVLREVKGRLAIDREGLHAWEFRPEAAPSNAIATHLVDIVGKGAQNSKRIEVSFSSIAPPAGQEWTLSAAGHLAIPIGKRGADRLQYLELGKGTCQHVLIGGRTGSGKSTLFHVMVVSASLWYAPKELEFHLIDFKKGVEFKAFASHHLPHARVIAIESDREFGLSVLRHLDQELTRRGDSFRKVGAQDLAAHRRAGGEHLPRILLMIDEFQEFFTEDDAIARDAALLLDRFVRQGRAFGLHVILGSQTLGGSYALAKSSLGQMGVRIALPCNESDAHLLLHEDNDATRLLSRPGDGIYNDRAGHVEGNSPFQVCWLAEEQESKLLEQVSTLALAAKWKSLHPAVVFEGNGPSRLEEEVALNAMVARPALPAEMQLRASVGQSSSLGGTAEAILPSSAGGNLLIIGQNREAAAATCAAISLGLAVRHAPKDLRFVSLDGEDQSGPYALLVDKLAALLPHTSKRYETRDIASLMTELSGILERRQSGEDQGRSPIILTVFALQRLRSLRPEDDAGFGREGSEPPSERFAKLMANGPEYGIHTLIWCDSLSSVQRGLGRRSLRDFDQRILFQMSGADSTELIDDDGASRLGLHTALLSSLSEGRLEKFRPFSLPNADFLERFGSDLRLRHGVA
jgi:S-DNA-T family DNA segregation ATPase FtsK/SpoIIIE